MEALTLGKVSGWEFILLKEDMCGDWGMAPILMFGLILGFLAARIEWLLLEEVI
jgi:hypothetical protein